MTKCKIGIILDYKSGDNGYSQRPYYAIRANYIDMITANKAMPIIIAYDYDSIDDYISFLDGLIVIGGFFDINPKRYNSSVIHPSVVLNQKREDFEFAFIEKFLPTKKPFLGICNGMQSLNVMMGGDIIQHIPDELSGYLNHEQSKVEGMQDSSKAYHKVVIENNSLLHDIVKSDKIMTNSSHHQAIGRVGNGLKVNARAEDGIIEGIELESHPFCLGVQWHPEFNVSIADSDIFSAFIKKTKENKIYER